MYVVAGGAFGITSGVESASVMQIIFCWKEFSYEKPLSREEGFVEPLSEQPAKSNIPFGLSFYILDRYSLTIVDHDVKRLLWIMTLKSKASLEFSYHHS